MIWNDTTNLVEQAQAGDRLAYGELIECFQPTIYATAMARVRIWPEAQELTQEVFLHGMKKLGQSAGRPVLCRLVAADHGAHGYQPLDAQQPLAACRTDTLEQTQAAGAGPLEELVRNEQRDELRNGLERLKPVDRDTLVAFYLRVTRSSR